MGAAARKAIPKNRLLRGRLTRQPARRPSVLEVEAPRHAVHVEHFAGEMESGAAAAFHGLEVDLGQLHAATGDELILEEALAVDREGGRGQLRGQRLEGGIADVRPRRGGGDARGRDETFPEALRHGDGAERGELLAGVLLADGAEFLEQRLARVRRHPVDLDGEFVASFGEAARPPGGELEDRRAAEAPVGDEDRPIGLEFRAGRGDGDVFHRDAREVGEARILDVEREEGRDGRDDGVAQGFGDRQATGGLVATGRDDQLLREVGGAVAEVERESRVGSLDLLDRGLDADAHEGAVGGRLQAVHDGARVIRHREHAAIFFGLRADPAFGEPGDGVARLEAVEGPEELPAPAWVFLHQLGRFEATVGHVAPPPAGYPDLGEQVGGGLEQGDHAPPAQLLGAGDRGEEAGGPTANDGDWARCGHAVNLAVPNALGKAGRWNSPSERGSASWPLPPAAPCMHS